MNAGQRRNCKPGKTADGVRHGLARVLSKMGLASRTVASRWIRDGLVRVDGRVVRDPEFPVLLGKKDLFAKCLTEKMLTYALGRGLEFYDRRAVDAVTTALAKGDYKFSVLVTELVKSDPFRMRRGKGQ